jgi:hypothetical protein
MVTERRSAPRIRYAGGVLPPAARVRPGRDVVVVDLAPTGALVEGPHRLKPGSIVEVHLQLRAAPHVVRARVERCFVVSIARGSVVRYRAGIRFESWVPVDPPEDPLIDFARSWPSGHEAARVG